MTSQNTADGRTGIPRKRWNAPGSFHAKRRMSELRDQKRQILKQGLAREYEAATGSKNWWKDSGLEYGCGVEASNRLAPRRPQSLIGCLMTAPEGDTAGRAWTPGPWRVEATTISWYVLPARGPWVATGVLPCDTWHQSRSEVRESEHMANARLIAAAPELFEALLSAQRIIERDFPNGQLVKDIRAALSRATATGEVK